MRLFSEKEQPYGLLSNFAKTALRINRSIWGTVNEYIYFNAMPFQFIRDRMGKELPYTTEPFILLQSVCAEFWDETYMDGLKTAMRYAIHQNDKLRSILVDGSSIIFVGNEELGNFLNDMRIELRQTQEVFPRLKSIRIIDGVTKALREGKDIRHKGINDLQHYETNRQPSDLQEDDEIFSHLDELVPYIKFRLDNEHTFKDYAWRKELFQRELFNKYLTHKIKTEHPEVHNYDTVMKEFISYVGKDEITFMKDRIYELFLKGQLAQELMAQVGPPPVKPQISFKSKSDVIIDNDRHPLSPFGGMGSVKIDHKVYRSPIHYAYSKMLAMLNITEDVTGKHPRELPEMFQWYENEFKRNSLLKNAQVAIRIKLETYPVLLHLLKTTKNNDIFWGDFTDPILGVGPDGNGENIVGVTLMKMRSLHAVHKSYSSPMANIYIRQWVLMRLDDIHNSMKTMIQPNIQYLEDLYRFPLCKELPDELQGLDMEDYTVIKAAHPEMSEDVLKVAWPLIYPQLHVISKLSDEDLVHTMVSAQELYLNKVPTNEEKDLVNKHFQSYFKKHADNMKLNNSASFAGRILSGNKFTRVQSSYDIFSSALNPRVFYWLNIATSKN